MLSEPCRTVDFELFSILPLLLLETISMCSFYFWPNSTRNLNVGFLMKNNSVLHCYYLFFMGEIQLAWVWLSITAFILARDVAHSLRK